MRPRDGARGGRGQPGNVPDVTSRATAVLQAWATFVQSGNAGTAGALSHRQCRASQCGCRLGPGMRGRARRVWKAAGRKSALAVVISSPKCAAALAGPVPHRYLISYSYVICPDCKTQIRAGSCPDDTSGQMLTAMSEPPLALATRFAATGPRYDVHGQRPSYGSPGAPPNHFFRRCDNQFAMPAMNARCHTDVIRTIGWVETISPASLSRHCRATRPRAIATHPGCLRAPGKQSRR
ncbi:hypothetical protein IP91_00574 [Pseudoduganella lurida]|uniref:Uncharacterized protein n=1 Tax=Pseudoduganella lurida TaxID=1036180 RepID=A0A562RKB9_9BURK|nr:hypothetical protein IP91_00574 [Pseudoduganella lurida]